MKVYVATSFTEAPLAKTVMEALEIDGHHITHNWTNENASGLQGDELTKYLTRCALADVDGVERCDVLLLLNNPKCRGAYTELGMAIALKKQVIVVWNLVSPNIFFQVPGVSAVDSVGEAMELIQKWSKEAA